MRASLNLNLPDPEWFQLLCSKREQGKSISEITRETTMSRPSVFALLAGPYPANSPDLVSRKNGAGIVKLYRDRMM